MATRRSFLRRSGVAVATIGVAGCSSVFGGSENETTDTPTETGTETSWRNSESYIASIRRNIQGRPVVAGDLVYVVETHGDLYALDRESGSVEWRFEMDGTVQASTVTGDVVYTGDYGPGATSNEIRESDGTAYAVDRHSGEAIWETDVSGMPLNTPVVRDDVVHYAALDDGVHTLATEDGAQNWSHTFDQGSLFITEPVVMDGALFATNRRGVFALDLAAQETYWTSDPIEYTNDPLATDSDWLYVAATTGIKALSFGTGDVEWTGESNGTPQDIAVADRVYTCTSNPSEVVAFDPATGSKAWEESITGDPAGLVLDDGTLYVATYDYTFNTGRICVLDTEEETLASEISFTVESEGELEMGSPPAVEDGLCYVGDAAGNVYAIDIDDESVHWQTTPHEATPTGDS